MITRRKKEKHHYTRTHQLNTLHTIVTNESHTPDAKLHHTCNRIIPKQKPHIHWSHNNTPHAKNSGIVYKCTCRNPHPDYYAKITHTKQPHIDTPRKQQKRQL